jgi:superfamily II DNA or RNA helicase
MRQLTYKIEGKISSKSKIRPIELIKNYKVLPNGVISIPQGRLDLVPTDYEIEDKRALKEVPFPTTKFELRDSQVPVYESVQDSCMINALVGWGKTFTALHIAKKLGQKTLVITHTTALRDQWIEETEKLFGFTPGIIGSGKFDIEDHFLVIGNIQTLVKVVDRISKEFGTVILDEMHHVPATTFSNVLDALYARYRIGLSGTLERTDGKHVVFNDYFGFDIYKPPQSHTMNPVVKLVPTGIALPISSNWAQKVNALLYDEEYQNFIANVALVQIAKGHSVLVVADRVEFLNKVKEKIGATCILITGETPFEERKELLEQIENGSKMCIAGSRQIFSEGISINKLSCAILAVPTTNPISLEQIIGRIMRLHPDKLDPVVLDMQFSSPSDKRQNAARLSFYASKGWKVSRI